MQNYHDFIKDSRIFTVIRARADEGTDRTTIGLPPAQLEFLQGMAAAARRGHKGKVVVVLSNGGPSPCFTKYQIIREL